MGNKFKRLEIIDRLFNLQEHVLKEEVTILAPHLLDMILKVIRTAENAEDEDQSSPIRQG
jgi:hypothetical protein